MAAELRQCIGSTKFDIPAHEAPIEEFASQPSQKDGLARMCRTHWSQYTRALRTGSKDAKPRRSAVTATLTPVPANGDLPSVPAEVETTEGQAKLAAAAQAAKVARQAAEPKEKTMTPAAIRMRNLRAARKVATGTSR